MIAKRIADGMRRLVGVRDRHAPMAFIGRESELSHLKELVNVTMQGPVQGAVRVIQGAPGTGKTALCGEFSRRLMESDAVRAAAESMTDENLDADAAKSKLPKVLCADISDEDLRLPPLKFVQTISKRIGETLRGAAIQVAGDRLGLSEGAMRGIRRGADGLAQLFLRGRSLSDMQDKAHWLDEQSTLHDCIDAYAEHVWPKDCTVALLLDEAQNCDVKDDRTANNIRRLCEGKHNGRLPLFCFGLPNTVQTLVDMGASRPPADVVRTLGCLEPAQGLEIVNRTLDALGLSSDNGEWLAHLQTIDMTPKEWDEWRALTAREIAEASGGFPQHVATGLMAIAQTLLNAPVGRKCDDHTRDEILAKHAVSRVEYYEGRLSHPTLSKHRLALGAVCELLSIRDAAAKPVKRIEALTLLKAGNDDGESVKNASDILDSACAKGILDQTIMQRKSGQASVATITPPPIKSMQTHLRTVLNNALDDAPEAARPIKSKLNEIRRAEGD